MVVLPIGGPPSLRSFWKENPYQGVSEEQEHVGRGRRQGRRAQLRAGVEEPAPKREGRMVQPGRIGHLPLRGSAVEGNHPGKGKGKAEAKAPCFREAQGQGRCIFGASCRFNHDPKVLKDYKSSQGRVVFSAFRPKVATETVRTRGRRGRRPRQTDAMARTMPRQTGATPRTMERWTTGWTGCDNGNGN